MVQEKSGLVEAFVKMREKGLVFGKGFLGTRISEKFSYQAIGREIDVHHSVTLHDFLEREKPNVVINCIGKTGDPNIDWCESHREETLQSNLVAALNLGIECARLGIYFVHLGSGCIYSGDNHGEGFSEEDAPNFYGPQFYAKTKILAEKALRELPSLILRIRMPVDDKPHPRNLIDKLAKYSRLIETKNSMTTVPHMLEAILSLIEKRKTGVYNLVNPGLISPAEIMQMYKELVDNSHNFEIFSLEDLNKETKAQRSNCYLNTCKLESEGIRMPEIHEGVRQCLSVYREAKK